MASETEPLSPALEALLQKLRKGMAAGLTPTTLPQVLDLFAGWTSEPVHAYTGASDTYALEPLTGVRLLTDAGQGEPAGPRQVAWHYDRSEAEKQRAALEPLVVEEFPDPTRKASPTYVLRHLSPVYEAPVIASVAGRKDDVDRPQFSFELYAKVRLTRVTTPDGQVFDIVTDRAVGFRSIRNHQAFFRWAAEHTSLLDRINARLGTEPYIKPADRVRTEDNVGTCGICAKRFKMAVEHGDVLVNHGYQRPGYGWLTDGCFGVGYQPYELSPAACEAAIVRWAQRRDEVATELKTLTAGEIGRVIDRRGRAGRPGKTYQRGDAQFERALAGERDRLDEERRGLDEDLDLLRAKVTAWAPHPEKIRRPTAPSLDPAVEAPGSAEPDVPELPTGARRRR